MKIHELWTPVPLKMAQQFAVVASALNVASDSQLRSSHFSTLLSAAGRQSLSAARRYWLVFVKPARDVPLMRMI
jgi:hypothetical protein